ncbi:hypothetical protein HN592_03400 [Candidatus Woesearchaeota archaeon]|jgi:hypothetical protein|nr:hypothetical protein [Candidatus Woesearchaeota archaeon]MBT4368258.1 hypothetical protein [Candidatus Woesearchaeota archaeon]MBT4712747.1 hypothetical protein [Candidatus Woesearchaeota archaeon]MBT6639659.1 hypothetical protein [Candidatus Woesearchaeota archaeon]MBT7133831.1 hypothetical protein [Candidatus Woesearchaeota archaeon]
MITKETFVVFVFFVIIFPLSAALWYKSGVNFAELLIVYAINTAIILLYISVALITHKLRLKKQKPLIEPEYDEFEDELECEDKEFEGFRNLFCNAEGGKK